MNPDYSQQVVNTPVIKTLKQRIMRRIYFLFMLRNVAPFAFDCLIIVIIAFIATLFVSVKDVLANFSAAREASGIANFSLSAFSETELETRILLVVLSVVGFLAVRDIKRAWRAVRTLRGDKSKTDLYVKT